MGSFSLGADCPGCGCGVSNRRRALNGWSAPPGHAKHLAMSNAVRAPMTLTEFLAWEERQELRYEFDGFAPVAMTGGTFGHDQITFELRKSLDARLAGKPCRPFGPNVKIIVDGRTRYPD